MRKLKLCMRNLGIFRIHANLGKCIYTDLEQIPHICESYVCEIFKLRKELSLIHSRTQSEKYSALGLFFIKMKILFTLYP
jgi:hypothetical protein